ncbi:MAG: type IV pili sensor histidine kinase and response regulator, partial [Planctomycetota bacterium]
MAESREPLSVSALEVVDQVTDGAASLACEENLREPENPRGTDVPRSPADGAPASELVVQEFLPMLAAWNQLAEPDKALPVQKPKVAAQRSGSKKSGESLRVPLARIDMLMQEVGELIINRSSFEQRMSDFGRCLEELQRAVERMRNVSHDLDTKYGVGALGGRQRLWGDG